MRVATVDGLVTLFYDGSKPLFNQELNFKIYGNEADENIWADTWESWPLSDECKDYIRERLSWQQVIVQEGVTEIPLCTFYNCYNIERVIFADSVIIIRKAAFHYCKNLLFIKWSINLQLIGEDAFRNCNLASVFIPPRCRYIGYTAFARNTNLTILNVPQDTHLGLSVIFSTKLHQSSWNPGSINSSWLKNINNDNQFALHRICSSFEPTLQLIVEVLMDKGGPKAFKEGNRIGITPSRYLKENPYAHVTEKEIIEKYIFEMLGENI
ncbi:hypothetical protein CTEN210_00338 [Chaetoceros tenuissimus]|uniref:Leucine-rich repeat domain-containing protein n=1 Tax=Chaetoceros tenuissimus TaxID=426638 RepID=A0AAD3GYQ8_9STRA|nr:hypothetical protein CTEN210_00338 [Chaetoceros tenuissimus]